MPQQSPLSIPALPVPAKPTPAIQTEQPITAITQYETNYRTCAQHGRQRCQIQNYWAHLSQNTQID
ncbi:unnamed protein product, partial [Pleuronectes platessa]